MFKKFLVWMVIFFFIQPAFTYGNKSNDQLSFITKSSGQSLFQTELTIYSEPLTQALFGAETIEKVAVLPVSTDFIMLENESKIRIFTIDESGQLYDIQRREKIKVPSPVSVKINTYFKRLHAIHFGSPESWDEVEPQIPRYTKFDVTDLETGLQFRVQRRAGKSHADVQPLTKLDTAIMKEIYDGKWSWKRRAILVHIDNRRFAASMHGMPHGGGALANGFPGHFCIHFKNSTTHASKSLDLAHQVMVYKAAGKLNQFVKQLGPKEVVDLFFVAGNQADLELLQLIYRDQTKSFAFINQVESIRIVNKQALPKVDGSFVFEIPYTYKIKMKGLGEEEKTFTFRVRRDSPASEWLLESIPL